MSFPHNQPEYSVSEISAHIKRTVEDTFGYVRVRGEISKVNVNQGSGHAYLTLKDDKAVLDAVCWKGTMSRLAHRPEAGMEVIATGKLTTYPGRSSYQLVIESLEPAGIGALMAMLEARKKQLAAEGLFDAARKKPLPFLPEVIGIITSPTGAVIRDILHRLSDRFPRHVLLWPVAVQGQGAAEQVAAAIAGFNAMTTGRPDLLIVARGGGSIEDLWAFNEEIVVRAAAASAIPLISAVGHETDTTLIDYAADKRAPTPTGAAEFAVPVREELRSMLDMLGLRATQAMRKQIAHGQERVQGLGRGLPRPQQLVATMAQALDDVSERLQMSLLRGMELRREKLLALARHVSPRFIALNMQRQWQEITTLHDRAQRAMLRQTERQEQRLQNLGAMLASLNVLAVLKRGFVMVKDAAGHVVPQAAKVTDGQALVLQFHDGVREVVESSAAPKPRKAAAKPAPKQAGLFD